MSNNYQNILSDIVEVAKRVVPTDGHVWLYGSRARNEAHADSDWDILILLNQQSITSADEDNIAYPLVVEGWKHDITISPQIYTYDSWQARSFTPFYKNVEQDKIILI